jgi:tRNA U34 5-carboxymethylaminomethyl modifying enzyme MnmG/GidA
MSASLEEGDGSRNSLFDVIVIGSGLSGLAAALTTDSFRSASSKGFCVRSSRLSGWQDLNHNFSGAQHSH